MSLDALLAEVRSCTICAGLPLGPRPILQASATARILIAGQAPGRITHHKGIPFDDPSGNNLRTWLGVTRAEFYDPTRFAIIPMGFCFPGTGKSGDLPPRPECAPQWRTRLLQKLPGIQLTLVIGAYAHAWHFSNDDRSLTERVKSWVGDNVVPLPHPSPRNGAWMKANTWFEKETLPLVGEKVRAALS